MEGSAFLRLAVQLPKVHCEPRKQGAALQSHHLVSLHHDLPKIISPFMRPAPAKGTLKA